MIDVCALPGMKIQRPQYIIETIVPSTGIKIGIRLKIQTSVG